MDIDNTPQKPEEKGEEQLIETAKTEAEELAIRLEQCERERNEYLELSLRMKADMMNIKKDQEKTLQSFSQYAAAGTIEKFLPILDSIALALKHVPKELEENGWVKGVMHIKQQIDAMLSGMNVKEIVAQGAPFDPNVHEAVAQEESEEHDGVVIEEMQKGYMLGDKVLRAAKVKIGHTKE